MMMTINIIVFCLAMIILLYLLVQKFIQQNKYVTSNNKSEKVIEASESQTYSQEMRGHIVKSDKGYCIIVATHWDYAPDDHCGFRGNIKYAEVLHENGDRNYYQVYSKLKHIDLTINNALDFFILKKLKLQLEKYIKENDLRSIKNEIKPLDEKKNKLENEIFEIIEQLNKL